MRRAFSDALLAFASRSDFVFLTGDLGFMALEELRDALGGRFINAGIAEQNMVSTAAGLARAGLRPWTYSIAPFIFARPFEQIRNDVCLHGLPVILVGNGGGYAYGVQGATHHALEDYGALGCLQGLTSFVPAFDADVVSIVERLFAISSPAYLRLGLSELSKGFEVPPYAAWRKLLSGSGPTVVVVGPLVGGLIDALAQGPSRPSLWLLTELPIPPLPAELLADLARSNHLIVVEEHVARGGAGEMMAHRLMTLGRAPRKFTHRHAVGYPTGLYGSQRFHRQECGLDPGSIAALVGEG